MAVVSEGASVPEIPQESATTGETGERGHLPTPLSPFLGREDDIAQVLRLLDDPAVRLLTLTGPGGVGKTRLAIEVAQRVTPDFADRVWFIGLEAIRDPDLALPAVAHVLGVQERDGGPLLALLQTELRDRHLLLVLDNFEQLLDTAPVWLTYLLTRCPRITALVTSRTALSIGGEHRYTVLPLPVPEPGGNMSATSATELFAQRARAVQPAFVLDETNRETIAEICRRLDGLPLAIEMAAAWIQAVGPVDLLHRLSDRFGLLSDGQRDPSPRLRSLRDAIGWSHDLLAPVEQTLFRRLAVFVGGFTLETAEMVCGADEQVPDDVISVLLALVDHSLVQRTTANDGGSRYQMLETIREFAAKRLAASGEEAALRDRHARSVLELAQGTRADTNILRQALAIDRLVPEQPNIEAALRWLHERDQGELLADLVIALEHYWYYHRPALEGLTWHQRALDYNPASSSRRMDLLTVAGMLAHMLDSPLADAYINELGALIEGGGTLQQRANTAYLVGLRAEDHGDYSWAETDFRTARAFAQQTGDSWHVVTCDYHLGVVAYGLGHVERAAEVLEGARQTAARIADPFTPAWCLVYLALIACERGDGAGALEFLRKHPDVNRSGSQAQDRLDHEHVPLVRAAAGVVACALGRHHMAARLLASAVHEVPLRFPERIIAERCHEVARQALGDAVFAESWDAGYRMRPDQVQADFDRLLSGHDVLPAGDVAVRQASSGLSSREMEVVRLLADGLTNREIAAVLYLSTRTVTSHLEHIMTKLAVRSRTAVVSFAVRNGLA